MIVRIKGVKTVRAKGRVYYYHRRTMTPLPGTPGSSEFVASLQRLSLPPRDKYSVGTLGSLILAYRASPEFTGLAAQSRRSYNFIFDLLAPNAGRPLISITAESLYELRDQLAKVRGRTTANKVLIVLRLVFNWAIKRGQFKGANPVISVDKLRRPRDARHVNRPWLPAELDAMLAAAPPNLRLALAIGAYTGLRESDVICVTWDRYDGRVFETTTKKTGQRVRIPAHSRLREILDVAPRASETIVPKITASGLRNAFYRIMHRLRDDRLIGEGLSFHGLRHTLGKSLAEAGCDPPTIAAVLGHSTSRMAEHYSRDAVRDHLAATGMAKLDK